MPERTAVRQGPIADCPQAPVTLQLVQGTLQREQDGAYHSQHDALFLSWTFFFLRKKVQSKKPM